MPDPVAARFPNLFGPPRAAPAPVPAPGSDAERLAALRRFLDRVDFGRWARPAPAAPAWPSGGAPDRFVAFAPGLHRGGRLTDRAQLRTLRDVFGVKTIVNLDRPTAEPEATWARELGMRVVPMHLPTDRAPTAAEWARIKDALAAGDVYVHCWHGKDRTGAVVARWRQEAQGWSPQAAYDEARRIGFDPYYAALRGFMNV